MYLESVLLLALATFRVARLFTIDIGPYKVFERLRNWKEWGVLNCIHCASLYIAPFMYLAWVKGLEVLVVILAVAGLVSLVKDIMTHD